MNGHSEPPEYRRVSRLSIAESMPHTPRWSDSAAIGTPRTSGASTAPRLAEGKRAICIRPLHTTRSRKAPNAPDRADYRSQEP